MGGMRARIDLDSCQSSGNCLKSAPDVFEWNEDHLAQTRPGAPTLPPERLAEIARNCPAMAIRLLDEEGREVDLFGE